MLNNIYQNRKVLITGHTGFKGSWLSLWLSKLGADILGCSMEPPTHPNHHDLLRLKNRSITCDVRDLDKLKSVFKDFKPEIVFHLAAQALVRESYQNPIYTFETNMLGTANVFEACRSVESVKAIVNITSDKCYENKEWIWGYREKDPMGGHDPYSASKGCAELICASYRDSFFPIGSYLKTHQTLVASCRAGNVIGGGDWGKDRLIPDLMKAASIKQKTLIRNPCAIRPWQHVLEPLSGYLLLGEKLLHKKTSFAGPWNFGPTAGDHMEVLTVIKILKKNWPSINYEITQKNDNLHEANLLKLDCSKANSLLKWRSTWDGNITLKKTTLWYRDYYENNKISSIAQLDEYIKDGQRKRQPWAIK